MTDTTSPPPHCPTCYSTDLQASRLRPEDRWQRLIFKLPIRCRNCRERFYASRSSVKLLPKSSQIVKSLSSASE